MRRAGPKMGQDGAKTEQNGPRMASKMVQDGSSCTSMRQDGKQDGTATTQNGAPRPFGGRCSGRFRDVFSVAFLAEGSMVVNKLSLIHI